MPTLSYSALQTFRTCPLQYKYAYLDKFPGEQTASMHFGTLLHQVMEELYATNLLPVSKDELINIISNKWRGDLYQSDQFQAEQDFKEAIAIASREWEKRQSPIAHHTIGLEKPFIFKVIDDFLVRGRIDRVDKVDNETLEIIDYKTGRMVPSQGELENNLQLAVYYVALRALWPNMKKVKLTLYYLRPDMAVSFEPGLDFEQMSLDKLKTVIASIKQSDFGPTVGSHCQRCSYRSVCPMMKHKYAKPEAVQAGKTLADTYVQLVTERKAIEAQIDQTKEHLDQFFANNEVQQVFGTTAAVRKSTSQVSRLNGAQVKTYLEAQGNLSDFIETKVESRLVISQSLTPIEEI
ncbi:MAG: PD-(D/E)XK nuclease family protein [Candidatus Abawacabacteria bacterium]|nr:PD-(D/E)XK nuclease family protein [Candidatus Abawacabacteria bacterium]